jgi:hypothetical protein
MHGVVVVDESWKWNDKREQREERLVSYCWFIAIGGSYPVVVAPQSPNFAPFYIISLSLFPFSSIRHSQFHTQ